MGLAEQRRNSSDERYSLALSLLQFSTPSAPQAFINDAPSPAFERPLQPRLFFGGGTPNDEALQRFWSYAGGSTARVVVIGWGSTISAIHYERFTNAFEHAIHKLALGSGKTGETYEINVQKIPDLEQLDGNFELALDLLRSATGIFVLGGDQVNLIEALKITGADALLRDLCARDAVVLGGTSAGTAIGSRTMIGGFGTPPTEQSERHFTEISLVQYNEEGVAEPHPFFVGEGLGVVPSDVLLEQHLLRPRRLERLLRAVESTPDIRWGVGIDDSMAAVWSGHGMITAVGPGRVLIVRKDSDGTVEQLASLTNGEVFDLSEEARQAYP
jgi:cyanophycinase